MGKAHVYSRVSDFVLLMAGLVVSLISQNCDASCEQIIFKGDKKSVRNCEQKIYKFILRIGGINSQLLLSNVVHWPPITTTSQIEFIS